MATAGLWMQYFVRHGAKSSRYLICVTLCLIHFLQYLLICNITLHTLKGLMTFLMILSVIYADDHTLYSKCDQTSDLCQQTELASELESDPQDTVDWGKK